MVVSASLIQKKEKDALHLNLVANTPALGILLYLCLYATIMA